MGLKVILGSGGLPRISLAKTVGQDLRKGYGQFYPSPVSVPTGHAFWPFERLPQWCFERVLEWSFEQLLGPLPADSNDVRPRPVRVG